MSHRVLLGKFPDGGYGLRVSRPGYDVASNPVDNERLVFNSDWPSVLPIHVAGTVSLAAGETKTVNFPALSYSPHVSGFVKKGSLDWQNFQMTNTFIAKTWTSGISTTSYLKGSHNEFAYDGTGTFNTNVQVRLFSSYMTVYASAAISFAYIVFRIQAF